jgi:hypothetical protein
MGISESDMFGGGGDDSAMTDVHGQGKGRIKVRVAKAGEADFMSNYSVLERGFKQAEVEQIFLQFDTNKSGVLEKEEATQFIDAYCKQKKIKHPKMTESLFQLLDVNKSNTLSWEELLNHKNILVKSRTTMQEPSGGLMKGIGGMVGGVFGAKGGLGIDCKHYEVQGEPLALLRAQGEGEIFIKLPVGSIVRVMPQTKNEEKEEEDTPLSRLAAFFQQARQMGGQQKSNFMTASDVKDSTRSGFVPLTVFSTSSPCQLVHVMWQKGAWVATPDDTLTGVISRCAQHVRS